MDEDTTEALLVLLSLGCSPIWIKLDLPYIFSDVVFIRGSSLRVGGPDPVSGVLSSVVRDFSHKMFDLPSGFERTESTQPCEKLLVMVVGDLGDLFDLNLRSIIRLLGATCLESSVDFSLIEGMSSMQDTEGAIGLSSACIDSSSKIVSLDLSCSSLKLGVVPILGVISVWDELDTISLLIRIGGLLELSFF